MSLASFLKSKFTTLDTNVEAVFVAIEPELQTLAKSEGAKLLTSMVPELPLLEAALTTKLSAVGLPSGAGAAISSAITSAIGPWLTSTLAKVAPASPASPAPVAPASPTVPATASSATKTTP